MSLERLRDGFSFDGGVAVSTKNPDEHSRDAKWVDNDTNEGHSHVKEVIVSVALQRVVSEEEILLSGLRPLNFVTPEHR